MSNRTASFVGVDFQHHHHHHEEFSNSVGHVLKNLLIILSNAAFVLPGIRCLELKKHVQAFVYFSILVTSSLYHACKFGAEDEAEPGGFCLVLEFDVYFVLDHVFATLTIPCMLLSFTPLDVVVFDFRNIVKRTDDGGGVAVTAPNGATTSSIRKRETASKEELQRFLFENYFSANTLGFYSIDKNHRQSNVENDYEGGDDDDDIVVSYEPSLRKRNDDDTSKKLITSYRPVFGITKKNILDFYQKSSHNAVLKNNMVGLENLYVCTYAYLITVSLLISFPNFAFIAAVCLSSLFVAVFWGVYFYVRHRIVTGFKSFDFGFGLALSIVAASLMLMQGFLPNSTYWITHSIWHVCAALGQWLLLRAKYRFSCYY